VEVFRGDLDVVYNHTAEANHGGPTLSFRDSTTTRITFSIQNRGKIRVRYADYTSTGNTLNANEKLVRRLIVDRMRIGPFSRHVGSSVLTRGEGEAQELQLDEPKVGSDLLRLAESALNDVGRGVRGLDNICGAEHEQCG